MNTPAVVAENYISVGIGKVRLHSGKMFLLAVMAGAFIALAGIGSAAASCQVTVPSIAKLITACVFPGGLMMVLLAGSELFTGNCLLVIPLLSEKNQNFGNAAQLGHCLCGKFCWCDSCGSLTVLSHQLSSFSGAMAMSALNTAIAKCSLTFGDAFLRGIACNFLVCIAVWISFAAKDVVGKIVGLYFPILLFVISGFERSIANMFYGPVGILAKSVPEYAPGSRCGSGYFRADMGEFPDAKSSSRDAWQYHWRSAGGYCLLVLLSEWKRRNKKSLK